MKNMLPSPLSTRKSERLEKRITAPQVARNSESVGKQDLRSPLRCSERGKKVVSSSSPGTKNSVKTSDLFDVTQIKEGKEKTLKQLAIEAKKIDKNGKYVEKTVSKKRKRMNGRAYTALFTRQKVVNASDGKEELNLMDKSSQKSGDSSGGNGFRDVDGRIDYSGVRGEELGEECVDIGCENSLKRSISSVNESVEDKQEGDARDDLFQSTRTIDKLCTEQENGPEHRRHMEVPKVVTISNEISDDVKTLVACSTHCQSPPLVASETRLDRGDVVMLSDRKNNTVEKDCDAYSVVANEDVSSSTSDAITSSPSGLQSENLPETQIRCLKKQRVGHYTTNFQASSSNVKSKPGLLDMSLSSDREGPEAAVLTELRENFNDGMRQNESSADHQKDGNFVTKLEGKILNSTDSLLLKPQVEEQSFAGIEENGGTLGSVRPAVQESQPTPNTCLSGEINGSHASSSDYSANNISEGLGSVLDKSDGRRKLHESQKNLYTLLKPEIAKLCLVLHLSEDVKGMVEKFLEYIMNNHLVNGEPATILQAFQISLCWTAASLLNHKIDHKESLALAKEHLKFACSKNEVYHVYSMLRCLKKLFLCRTGYLQLPKGFEKSNKSVSMDESDVRLSKATFDPQIVEIKADKQSCGQECLKQVSPQCGSSKDFQLAEKDIAKSIKEIQKKCQRQLKKLLKKQKEEKEDFSRKYEEEKAQLANKKKKTESVISLLRNTQIRTDKLKKVDIEYSKKFEELKHHMHIRLQNLEAMQVAARNNLFNNEAIWVERVKSWAHNEIIIPPLDKFNLPEIKWLEKLADTIPGAGMNVSEACKSVPYSAVSCGDTTDMLTPLLDTNSENAELVVTAAVEGASDIDGEVNVVSVDRSLGEQTKAGVVSDREAQKECPEIIISDQQQEVLQESHSFQKQIFDGATLTMHKEDITLGLETVSSENYPENVVNVDVCSTIGKTPEEAISRNQEIPVRTPETQSFSEGQENTGSLSSSISAQNPDGASSFLSDGHNSCRVPKVIESRGDLENVVLMSQPIGELVPIVSASCMPEMEVVEKVPHTASSEVLRDDNACSENDRLNTVAATNPIELGQQNGENSYLSQDTDFQEISLENTPLVQPVSTSGQDDVLLLDQVSVEQVHGLPVSSMTEDTRGEPEMELPDKRPDTAPSEVLRADNTFRENNRVNTVATANPIEVGQQNGEISYLSQDTEFQEISTVRTPLVQPVSSSGEGGLLPLDQISGEQVPASSVSYMEEEDAPRVVPVNSSSNVVRSYITTEENDRPSTVTSSEATGVGQQSGEICVLGQDIHFQVSSVGDTPLVQAVNTSGNGDSLPSDQSLQEECSLPTAGVQLGDPVTIQMANMSIDVDLPTLSHQSDFMASDQSNAVEGQMQLLPSRYPPSSSHDLPSTSSCVHLQCSEDIIISQTPQSSVQLVAFPNQAVIRPPGSTSVHLPNDTPIGGVVARASNTTPRPSNHHVPTQMPAASRLPQALYNDPLLNEMERIFKKMDQMIKIYEKTKVQLNSECEKELLESNAKIRSKYKDKLQGTEADFLLKKKELELNYNRAMMSKILAETFISKCTDSMIPDLTGMQHEVPSSFMQQLVQQSSLSPSARPSIVTGLASDAPSADMLPTAPTPMASLPNASSQAGSPPPPPTGPLRPTECPQVGSEIRVPLPPTRPHAPTGSPQLGSEIRAHLPPTRPPPPTGSPQHGIILRVTLPPTRPLRPIECPLPGSEVRAPFPPTRPLRPIECPLPGSEVRAPLTPTRPPPPTGSPHMVSSEIRAPAPHLQRLRPSTFASPNSRPALSHGMPSTTHSSATNASLYPHRTLVPPSNYQPVMYNRAIPPKSTSGLPAHPNSSPSVMQLLLNVSNLATPIPNLATSLPQPINLGANLGPVAQSQSTSTDSLPVNPAQTSEATDVVCLSDDD